MGIRRWLSGTLRPDALKTDEISVGNDGPATSFADIAPKIEGGTVRNTGGVPASADDTWGTNNSDTFKNSVTFDEAFESAPKVFLTFNNKNKTNAGLTVEVDSTSTTGFTAIARNYSDDANGDYTYNWLAVGV
jgi:hypothetical protein